MAEVTLDDLRRILRDCAGQDESVDLDGDIADLLFAEIGYDSLAMLETVSRVEREFGTSIPDEAVQEMVTPRTTLAYINRRLAEDTAGSAA
ncbi:phosphopantetheine-binding protein [Streptosporangium soli]|nr:phosphopantetheine-binding protein [Streptosporangium sp. KLBMP 9127]